MYVMYLPAVVRKPSIEKNNQMYFHILNLEMTAAYNGHIFQLANTPPPPLELEIHLLIVSGSIVP